MQIKQVDNNSKLLMNPLASGMGRSQGGSEGYKNTIQRDMYKTKYLSDHNIPQLIISYMDYDNIENILDNWIIRISK